MLTDQQAKEWINRLITDAEGPNTGSFQSDAQAWPGSGIHEIALAARLTSLLRRIEVQAGLKEAKEFRLNDNHYHNTFEPDNCNCMFCKRITALETQARG